MNLSAFTSTAKHIVASTFIALVFFTLLASQSTEAAQTYQTKEQANTKLVYLVSHMETSLTQAKEVLEQAQQQFENNEISTEEIFFVTLKFYEIENEYLKAKVALAANDGTLECESQTTENSYELMAHR
jgi:hypothetical protein